MWRRVYRQRRRLLIGFALFVLIGLLLTPARSPFYFLLGVIGMPIAVISVMAVVITLRPRWGVAVEILGVTILLQELLFAAAPLLEMKIREAGIIFQMGLWFVIYYALFNVVVGMNRIYWPNPVTMRASRRIDAPPDRLWRALALEPGRAHWDPDIEAVRPAAGAEAVELVPVDPEGPVSPGTVERQISAEPGRFRHSLRRSDPPEAGDPERTTDERFRLEPDGRQTRVTLTQTHRGVPVVTAVRLWLEDQAGDTLDDFAAIIGGRANWSRAHVSRRRRHRGIAASG